MHRLKAFWQLVSEFGCHDALQPPELKRIRLANQASVILAFFIFFYALVFGFYGPALLGWVTLGVSLLFCSIPILQKITSGAIGARYFFLLISYASVFIYSLLLGRDTGIQLFFISAIATPFVVLDIREKSFTLMFSAIPILLLMFLELYVYDFFRPVDLPPQARRLIYLMVLPSAALITFFYSGYFYLINQRSEKALYCTIQDLHQSKKLVEDQQLRLTNASRLSAIGELSGSIAHEINNPLSIILGYTEVIARLIRAEPVDRERIMMICDRILHTINRITKIVLGLRKLSREGNDDPMEVANLRDVIEDATSVCSESLSHAGIELRIKMPDQSSLCLCRPLQISQVLLNLIQNAKDAIQSLEKKWIEIEVQAMKDQYLIAVKDSGHIVDPEILGKIGQPFFTTKPPGKGTGLGLSISRKIMASHGGSLDLDKKASSTTFVLQLPRKVQTS